MQQHTQRTTETVKAKVNKDIYNRLNFVYKQYGFKSVNEILLCLIVSFLDYVQCDDEQGKEKENENEAAASEEEAENKKVLRKIFKEVCNGQTAKNKNKDAVTTFALCGIKERSEEESETTYYSFSGGLYGKTKNKDVALLSVIRFLDTATANILSDFKAINGYKTIPETLRALIPFALDREIKNIFSEYTDAELKAYGFKPKRARSKTCI